MSGGVSASTVAMMGMAAVGGMAMASAMTPDMPTPKIQDPVKPPQATKAPEKAAVAGATAAAAGPGGALSGNAGTFLTGPSGIDPSTLNLGRNTLLGQ